MQFLKNIKSRLNKQKGTSQAEPGSSPYGLDLKSGDRHYRAWVGPPEDYDLISALQVTLLLTAGLKETHSLCDVGCGSLRAGRLLIPYLRSGNYFGLEPEEWLVQEGIERELGRDILDVKHPRFRFVSDFSLGAFETRFDFVVAQSVFSHCFPDLLRLGLRNMAGSLSPTGKVFATFYEVPVGEKGRPKTGRHSQVFPNGWVRKGGHSYSWEEMERYLDEAGLVGRRLSWPHPRQKWFVSSLPEAEKELEDFVGGIRNPRPGWGEK